ncbi:MAG: glycosyltransferase family 4 protein, partial [Geminicoccaceae bacterium]
KILGRLRPDLVLGYTPKGVIYGAGAARLAGIPRIYTMISGLGYPFIEGRELKRRLLKRTMLALYRRSLAYSRAVFFQNRDDLDEFRRLRLISDRQTVVRVEGSGVDTEHFAAAPVPEGPPAFLLIARLLRDKGIFEYVEAARRLRARHPDVAFRLLGPADDHPNAIGPEQLDSWRKEGVIEYLGETSDVRPYLSSSTAYVLPSYREGMPRTVLEAMSMGRAVITTDVPGCRETVVPGHNGFLVPLRDGAALADAMERFILQPDLTVAMGARSREIALERFDVRRVNAVMLRTMELA